MPQVLTEKELVKLRGVGDRIDLDEVSEVYLPLSRLIHLRVRARQELMASTATFLCSPVEDVPFVIGVAGSVAVGKSTTARLLQVLLQRWESHPRVDLITTDGFLHPLSYLQKHQLLQKKGFPISYDTPKLIRFLADIKSGKHHVKAPIYSHLTYDIIPDQFNVIDQPDILILEGLNVLQPNDNHANQIFVSDFVDFSIYVDADEALLKEWYIRRFLKFRQSAFSNPNSYFKHYANLSEQEAIATASQIWDEINGLNLKENILPTRERANLILKKGANHEVELVKLRK